MSFQETLTRLQAIGQEHLLRFAESLDENGRVNLLASVNSCNFELLANLHRSLYLEKKTKDLGEIKPFPDVSVLEDLSANERLNLREAGLNLIVQGKVAALVMAAGTGTRLGFEFPKGMYDIQLISHKSLFQLQAEKLLALEKLARDFGSIPIPPIPWLIMTNKETNQTISDFFEENDYFGLDAGQVRFFEQGMIPSVDLNGKLILDKTDTISQSPNGNGGVYSALETTGSLTWLEDKGVEFVHLFSVDNVLNKICDPTFIGFCAFKGLQAAIKTVPKTSPEEAIGVIVLRDGRSAVVEYSAISEEMSRELASDGSLKYNTGMICSQVFTVSFIRQVVGRHLHELEKTYNLAIKKIPFIDAEGHRVVPTDPNGLKFELFYFDVLQFADRTAVLQVRRNEEFAPVKNAPGSRADSPDTARQFIQELHKMWLIKAGARFSEASTDTRVEISPLISYEGEGLETFTGQTLNYPVYIYY